MVAYACVLTADRRGPGHVRGQTFSAPQETNAFRAETAGTLPRGSGHSTRVCLPDLSRRGWRIADALDSQHGRTHQSMTITRRNGPHTQPPSATGLTGSSPWQPPFSSFPLALQAPCAPASRLQYPGVPGDCELCSDLKTTAHSVSGKRSPTGCRSIWKFW
jgi:hypothetical protein